LPRSISLLTCQPMIVSRETNRRERAKLDLVNLDYRRLGRANRHWNSRLTLEQSLCYFIVIVILVFVSPNQNLYALMFLWRRARQFQALIRLAADDDASSGGELEIGSRLSYLAGCHWKGVCHTSARSSGGLDYHLPVVSFA
jgi:hypothetical protein